jgi:hypothetical protein
MSGVSTVVALWGDRIAHDEDAGRVREEWPELADALDALVLAEIQGLEKDTD